MKNLRFTPLKLAELLIVLLVYPVPWLVSYLATGSYDPMIGFSLGFSLSAGVLVGIFFRTSQKHRGIRFAALAFAVVLAVWVFGTVRGMYPSVLQQNMAILATLTALLGLVLALLDRSLDSVEENPKF